MKTRTVKIVRVVGIVLLIFACCMWLYACRDTIAFNGKELIAIVTLVLGLYMTFGSEKSIKSWGINWDDDDDDYDFYDDVDDDDDDDDEDIEVEDAEVIDDKEDDDGMFEIVDSENI